jgi:decaprenyl-phosphate phosphoribosyltransferase
MEQRLEDTAHRRIVPARAADRRERSKVLSVLAAARPRQWIKNLLVFAAPAAAAVVRHPVTIGRTAAAAALFCVASSGVYLLNDSFDVEADRVHPVKRLRPVAAGELSTRLARLVGVVALAVAVAGGGLLGGLALAGVLGAYGLISLAYSMRLKRVPVIELACVSSGFVLRAVAGGVAAHVPLSPWFLVVACAGSLYVALGKRTAEFGQLGLHRAEHRAALGWYRMAWLQAARWASAGVTVAAYCLWAIARSATIDDRPQDSVFILLSMVPFALAVLALERAFAGGRGGAPENLVLRDRLLQGIGLSWAVLLVLALAL